MTLAEKLQQAESAYHKLVTGTQARVVVDQNGERVEFTAANAARLRMYIEELKAEAQGRNFGAPAQVFF